MEELQIAKLPSNFKVYEIDDYHAINCDKEAKNFLDKRCAAIYKK